MMRTTYLLPLLSLLLCSSSNQVPLRIYCILHRLHKGKNMGNQTDSPSYGLGHLEPERMCTLQEEIIQFA